MVFALRFVVALLVAAAMLCRILPAAAQSDAPASASARVPPVSSTAERIFEAARGKLLQIRVELAASGRQSSLGSAFLVDSDLAITNYHVVSEYVLEPDLYRLEYFTTSDSRGALQVLAFDIADDLALVRVDHPRTEHFVFDPRKLDDLVKGEQLYAMGNPLDIGFAIVEGRITAWSRAATRRISISRARSIRG